jgi:lambda repressor-like predicted transcriptional regulator
MEDKDNEWHISQNGHNKRGSLGNTQVPSCLLQTVLHRLGLTPEQALSEILVDDLIARLKSDDWEVRIAAVRALGKLNSGASVELLVSALDDEDGSVRAAAVHALGNVGKQAPLQQLMVALRDSDWHVRETALLVLGKQEQRVPDEVLTIALYDRDVSVREAARLALQWHAVEERTSASYGGLQEQRIMQHDRDDTSLPNSGEAIPGDAWHSSMEYAERSREQVQEYASYEYGNAMSLQGEKVTIQPQRRSQRGWWVIVVIVALLFFLLGNMTQLVMPVRVPRPAIFMMHHPESSLPFESPSYATILQNDVARGLNLSPKDITAQLKEGKSMTDIAKTQGFSPSQLQNIELKSFQDVFGKAVSSGDIDQQEAYQWMWRFQHEPALLDKVTVQMFQVDSDGG